MENKRTKQQNRLFRERFCKKHGYDRWSQYFNTTPAYKKRLKNNQPNKFKEEAALPNDVKEIPFAPGYYVSPKAEIFKYSDKLRKWIELSQQQQKSGYMVFQPIIKGKRSVRYVHIAMAEAFISLRPDKNYQVDHIDHCKHNNNITNLQWLTRSENLKRRKW